MTSMLKVLIENKIKIYVHFVNGKWIEADSKDDVWIHDWRETLYKKIIMINF